MAGRAWRTAWPNELVWASPARRRGMFSGPVLQLRHRRISCVPWRSRIALDHEKAVTLDVTALGKSREAAYLLMVAKTPGRPWYRPAEMSASS